MNIQKKHQFLDDFSDDELAQLHEAAKSGASMQSIADMIQQEWGKCTDKTPEALRKAVERYVAFAGHYTHHLPKRIAMLFKAKADFMPEFLRVMIMARLARLEKPMHREYATGVLDPEVTKELRAIQEIVQKALSLA